jgi:hypothetical protein
VSDPGQSLKFTIADLFLSAPAFSVAGGAVTDAASSAKGQLDGLGAFWGNDAAGRKFASFYEKNQSEILQLLGVAGAQVTGIADGINEMAARYDLTEQSNVGEVLRLGHMEQEGLR